MLVTLTLLATLAMVALPLARVAAQQGREADLRQALWQIRHAIDAHKAAMDGGRITRLVGASGYPPTLEALTEGVTDIRNPAGAKLYFLRRIPRDPMCQCPGVPAVQTWGLRAYASPPDAPERGDDVFDVYSTSPDTGLNGIPYKEW
ncbi:general secretion pathway protein G [Cupriavidus agavae]|uniref:General secretion pathway protein G n=2 Tax=Cupriavidus agavae TaxID=1001822 RepID=A0A4V2FEX1_9BURK|nr:general secretion pathway protein G [Cupriavidus agavae]